MSKLKKLPVLQDEKIIGYEAPVKQLKIVECSKAEADSIIIPNHYSHKATRNSCINLLVYYKGKVEGALQIGYGIRPKIKGNLEADSTREFDRMFLTDVPPKFSETIVLSLLIHYLKKVHPEIKHLISYADTSAGNNGTIYKAGNFKFIKKIKADFYILNNGERVHPVSMWHRHGTRKWEVLKSIYPDIKKADGFQLKFVYDL